jgi:hypothetical protein
MGRRRAGLAVIDRNRRPSPEQTGRDGAVLSAAPKPPALLPQRQATTRMPWPQGQGRCLNQELLSPTTASNDPVSVSFAIEDDLIERARQQDDCHWAEHQRPISADTLRKQLRIGAAVHGCSCRSSVLTKLGTGPAWSTQPVRAITAEISRSSPVSGSPRADRQVLFRYRAPSTGIPKRVSGRFPRWSAFYFHQH